MNMGIFKSNRGTHSGFPGRRRSFGQASIEYTIVVMLVVVVLISYTDESGVVHSAIGDVVQALKDVFGAYSWAISFSNNITPL
jgi:Flp pilus assembly pilin Flp